MTICTCPTKFGDDPPHRLERYALAFNCEQHADKRVDPVTRILELEAENALLKARLDQVPNMEGRHDER